jgi:hypothetical protein
MELIERYVHAVGQHLPHKSRADIQAELQSTLVDTLEARAKGEVTQDQVVNLLKEFGPPEKVAASYWPEGQYLIGPRLYPLFRMVAGIALSVFVIVQLVLLGILMVFNQEPLLSVEYFGGLVSGAFSALGVIVLVFAVLQRLDVRPETEEKEWDPRQLPAHDETEPISRGGLLIEITFSLVLIAILLFLPDRIGAIIRPGADIVVNPVILNYLPLIIAAVLIGIGMDVILLWRERWETWSRIAKIGASLFGIYVLYVLVAAHSLWLSQHGVTGFFSPLAMLPEGSIAAGEGFQIMVMQAFRLAFVVALIVTVVDTGNMLYRLARRVMRGATPTIAST